MVEGRRIGPQGRVSVTTRFNGSPPYDGLPGTGFGAATAGFPHPLVGLVDEGDADVPTPIVAGRLLEAFSSKWRLGL
jgi:hypothetical protein